MLEKCIKSQNFESKQIRSVLCLTFSTINICYMLQKMKNKQQQNCEELFISLCLKCLSKIVLVLK